MWFLPLSSITLFALLCSKLLANPEAKPRSTSDREVILQKWAPPNPVPTNRSKKKLGIVGTCTDNNGLSYSSDDSRYNRCLQQQRQRKINQPRERTTDKTIPRMGIQFGKE